MRYLILGGGPAGIAGARAIRKTDPKAEVVIANSEPDPPYLRPLIPEFISGKVDRDRLADPQAEGLDAIGIDLRLGTRATAVVPEGRRVRFADGTEEVYDYLLLATGGSPLLPPPLDRHPKAVLPVDSLADAHRIRARAAGPGPVIVYGPGYVGIEASRALSRLGRRVIWIKPDLPRFGYPISGEFEASVIDQVRNRGVTILDGDDIASIREVEEGVFEVRDLRGENLRCSMIAAAVERLPAVDYLKGSGVKVGTGVIVDDRLRTSVPGIFAAGDCAELYDEKTREVRINFGWRSAIRQGRLAGENMAGGGKRYIRRQEDYLWLLFGTSQQDRAK